MFAPVPGPRELDPRCMDRVALYARPLQPHRNSALIHATSSPDSRPGALTGQQSHDAGHCLSRRPQPRKHRALGGGAGLPTRGAGEALLLARVDAHVALAPVASRGIRPMGADYGRGVDDAPPLGYMRKRAKERKSGPPFLLQANLPSL